MLGGAVSQTKSKVSGNEQRERELEKVEKPEDSSLPERGCGQVCGKEIQQLRWRAEF